MEHSSILGLWSDICMRIAELIISGKQTCRYNSCYINKQKEIWQCFDPENKSLAEIIENDYWQHIGKAVKMRNRLVHGKQSYSLEECKTMTSNVMSLLEPTVAVFNEQYDYDGWSNVSTRKVAKLHIDPEVGRSKRTSS